MLYFTVSTVLLTVVSKIYTDYCVCMRNVLCRFLFQRPCQQVRAFTWLLSGYNRLTLWSSLFGPFINDGWHQTHCIQCSFDNGHKNKQTQASRSSTETQQSCTRNTSGVQEPLDFTRSKGTVVHFDQDGRVQRPGEMVGDVDAKEFEAWYKLHCSSVDVDGGMCVAPSSPICLILFVFV